MRPTTSTIPTLGVIGIFLAGVVVLATTTADEPGTLYVPGAAHVAGSNNTVWRTDLEIRSVSAAAAQVRIDLLRKDRDNTDHPAAVVNIEPWEAQRFEDALDLLFGFEGSATLRLTPISGEVRATSRTYNLTSEGTYGQFIGGAEPTDSFEFGRDATLIQLSSSPDRSLGFRTNIGLVNLVAFPVNMEIDLYHADLQYVGRLTTTLQAYEYDQIDDAFGKLTDESVEDGFAIVRAITYGGQYLAYASVIDNRTGDPIYQPAMSDGTDPIATPPPDTPTPTPTQEVSPTPTPTPTPTPGTIYGVTVTTLDEESYELDPSSIRFVVGNGIQTSLVLCSFDGTLSQVSSGNFSFIEGPTETVAWPNCCANFGARLEYETWVGIGGPAVARSTCTAGTPYFGIRGTEIGTGATIEVDGADLDIAVWP